jgi:hypothetical protein
MSTKDLNITVSGMNNLEIKDLLNELKISEKNIGSDISYKFVGENSRIEILQILEKYGISTLENVVEYMKKHKTTLFNIIIERRTNYVNKVRQQYRKKTEIIENKRKKREVKKVFCRDEYDDEHSIDNDDSTIDFTGDPDDTHNLACGVNVISNAIDKINHLINYKIQQKYDEEYKTKFEYFKSVLFKIFIMLGLVYIGVLVSEGVQFKMLVFETF